MRDQEEPLPRIEDVPIAERGYERDAVENAFDRFERRLLELEARLEVLDDVRDELRALRGAAVAGLEQTLGDDEEWPSDLVDPPLHVPDARWVAAVPPPAVTPSSLPRLTLEAAFLLAVALLSALAGLPALAIVLLMAAAWGLVALNEWLAAERRGRWAAHAYGGIGEETAESSPWDVAPVEATIIAPPDESESRTIIARLPLPEASAPRRRLRLFRRRGAEAAADPWEAEPE